MRTPGSSPVVLKSRSSSRSDKKALQHVYDPQPARGLSISPKQRFWPPETERAEPIAGGSPAACRATAVRRWGRVPLLRWLGAHGLATADNNGCGVAGAPCVPASAVARRSGGRGSNNVTRLETVVRGQAPQFGALRWQQDAAGRHGVPLVNGRPATGAAGNATRGGERGQRHRSGDRS